MDELRGLNVSTLYRARIAYALAITCQDESIKIEVSLRKPIVEPPPDSTRAPCCSTRSPVPRQSLVFRPVSYRSGQAYADRLRVALTQPEPAVRGFFDMDHAIASGRINASGWSHIDLLRTKLSVPEIGPTDVSPVDERRERRDARTRREEHGTT